MILLSLPPLPPDAVHIFVPVLYVLLFVVLLFGGIVTIVWRLFVWLKSVIRDTVGTALDLHVLKEEVWQREVTQGQEQIRREIVEVRTELSEVRGEVAAVRSELAEVKRLVDGMEREREIRHELDELHERQLDDLKGKGRG